MKLSPVVGRYFDAWIRQDTWDSGHRLDRERFYRFVKAVARYSRRPPALHDIRLLIVTRWKQRRQNKWLNREAEQYAALYEELLEYERTRGFPDPLIERTSTVRFFYALQDSSRRAHKGKVDVQHVDKVMTDVWGKDWREKLKQRGTQP